MSTSGSTRSRLEPPTPSPGPETAANSPAQNPSPTRPTCLWLGWIAILLIALIWRTLGITTTEVWRDEAITLIHAKGAWLDLIRRLPFVEDTPPLGFLLFKAWTSISDTEWFARLLPVLLGTAWVDVIMRTARLIHPRAWWAAGILAAFSQVPIHYAQEIRAYALLMLMTGLCFWAAERALAATSKRRWLYALVGFAAVAAHSHMAGVFVLPTAAAYLLLRSGRIWRDYFYFGPFALWTLLVLPLVWFARHWSAFHHQALDAWWVMPISVPRALDLAWQFFGMAPLSSWAARNQQEWVMWTGFAGERLVMVSCVALIALALANKHVRSLATALLLSSALYIAALYISGRMTLPNILDRTLLPAWTPIVLALAMGTVASEPKWKRACGFVAVLLLAVIWGSGWAWTAYNGPARRMPTERWFARFRDRIGPHDLIYTAPRWFKEMTVYRLQDQIDADQLLDEFESYQGKPPRHRLVLNDAHQWREHFDAKLKAWRERYGNNFNIWAISMGAHPSTDPNGPGYWIASQCREAEQYEEFVGRALVAVRYIPKPLTTTTAPSAP